SRPTVTSHCFVITAHDGRGDQHEIEVPMSTMSNHTQPEFSTTSFLVKPSVEASAGRAAEVKNDQLLTSRSPIGKRASLAFAYYPIVFFVGVAATLAWQTYGDTARQLIAQAASTPDQQQLNGMLLDL